MVTVELQLCGDLFFSLGCSDCRKNKIDILFSTSFVCNNTVVVEVTNDRKIQCALSCFNIRNICYPFLIGSICVEISVEQIGIPVQVCSIIAVFFTAHYGKQVVFLHNAKNGLRILMYSLPFKPYMHSAVAICTMATLLTFPDLLGQRQILCRRIYSFDIVIVATSGYIKEPAHLTDRNTFLCDDRSPYILRLSSLPFCEREKIPHQFVFHL